MNSVVQLIEWINNDASPININIDESFSIPFATRYDGKMKMAIFTYSHFFSLHDVDEKIYVRTIYYLDPQNPALYKSEIIDEYSSEEKVMFSNETEKNKFSPQGYAQLVELTDMLILDPHNKEIAIMYAEEFNACTNKMLVPFYLKYGEEFFEGIRNLLNEKS